MKRARTRGVALSYLGIRAPGVVSPAHLHCTAPHGGNQKLGWPSGIVIHFFFFLPLFKLFPITCVYTTSVKNYLNLVLAII